MKTKYVLVGHSTAARRDGVGSYSRAVLEHARRWGRDVTFLPRDESVSPEEFPRFVRDTITARFRSSEVIVEGPEIGCPTLLLPPEYRVHVRLHCPGAFVDVFNGRAVDRGQFGRELEAIRRAHAVSSPSYSLLNLLRPHLDVSRIHVYKNPPPTALAPVDPGGKGQDVVFLGRFRRVKGVDFLDAVLRALPPSYAVVLAGRGFEAFEPSPAVRCRVDIRGEVGSSERDRLLGGSRVALVPSRFENCSMVVLEALAAGTVVVGWQVGGHREIAGSELIRLVPFGETDALVAMIVTSVEASAPSPDLFRAATDRVADDFRRGWHHVWEATRHAGLGEIYRGLHCGRPSATHAQPVNR